MLLWWRILHRYSSTNRRRYAQKPSHRTPFMRRYSYTESFVHREVFTHRRLHTHRGFYAKNAQKLLHTDALHKDVHRCFYTQRSLHTIFCTEKPCIEQFSTLAIVVNIIIITSSHHDHHHSKICHSLWKYVGWGNNINFIFMRDQNSPPPLDNVGWG